MSKFFITTKIANDFKFILFIIGLMWGLEIANLILDRSINQLALTPRKLEGLFGVLGMHFLHWDIPHLLSNTIPLLILGFLVCLNGKGRQVTFLIMLLTGLLVWLFARNGIHAGASGLVFGYWGYLLSSAYFERSLKNIALAIFTILVYGGILFGLIDFRESVSFEGHIFGLIAGVVIAWFMRKKTK